MKVWEITEVSIQFVAPKAMKKNTVCYVGKLIDGQLTIQSEPIGRPLGILLNEVVSMDSRFCHTIIGSRVNVLTKGKVIIDYISDAQTNDRLYCNSNGKFTLRKKTSGVKNHKIGKIQQVYENENYMIVNMEF